MTYLPYSLAKELVADHQRELERSAARWRIRRRRDEAPVATRTPSTVAAVTPIPTSDDHQTTAAA